MKALYQATDPTIWQGRADSQPGERYFQIMECVDPTIPNWQPEQTAPVLLGFCSDAGVVRNLGRPGSVKGPAALRQALANLPSQGLSCCYDVGDVICDGDELEAAQQALADQVATLLTKGLRPVVMGGGHETAWGHYQGIAQALPTAKLGIINFDAHFDLRMPIASGLGSSGTPFFQIATARQAQQLPFSYYCVGIQPLANTESLFNTANELGVQYSLAETLYTQRLSETVQALQDFIERHDAIYLSICLDVFCQSVAPGVSAPQPLGLSPWQVIPLLKTIMATGKVISTDVVELSPVHDIENMTAKLGASLIAACIQS